MMRMRLSRNRVIVGTAGAVLIAASLFYMFTLRTQTSSNQSSATQLEAGLGELKKRSGSSADTSKLGSGLHAPTNSWISGAVLQADPKPVFPSPLSLRMTNASYEMGLPNVTVGAKSIVAPHVAHLTSSVKNAKTTKLIRFDKVTATFRYNSAQRQELGDLTIAQGSPYTFYQSYREQMTSIASIHPVTKTTDRYVEMTTPEGTYAAKIIGKGTFRVNGQQIDAQLKKGDMLTLFVAPSGKSDELSRDADNRIISAATDYTVQGKTATTTITYKTAKDQPTYLGSVRLAGTADDASFETLYGQLPLERRSQLVFKDPLVEPSQTLDLSNVSSDKKDQLRVELKKDVTKTVIDKQDTYFAGKQLARAANLLMISKQLGDTKSVDQLITIMNRAFDERLGSRYFYYDDVLQGVAPYEAAFGAEDFNDHHFHYGYFIYAASMLATYDKSFLEDHRQSVDLLVADIASPTSTDNFPALRTFDPYAGHSWAAGLAPFADGNNQESSSEAVHAWNAVANWATVIKDERLKKVATALLSAENAQARERWRDVSIPGYEAPLSVLNWGGKRDYATFFSDEKSVKLGIQLIPLDPSMMKSFTDTPRLSQKLLDGSIADDSYNVALGDYDLMYLALHNPQKAESLVASQQSSSIDDGNSRTYLRAWIDARASR